MHGDFARLVIVGGGTAGWLSAAYLAARCPELDITIVEAPDIPTIGVGEGSWPTLRKTLATIGISEVEFLTACDASFKQGSRFDGWANGGPGDSYYHPFTAPIAGDIAELLSAWKGTADELPFSYAMNPQAAICDRDLAPRQRAMPDFAGALNYGYHLDAGKLAVLLARHAVQKLGVTHVRDTAMDVETGEDGFITALRLREGEPLRGDFFIDCTGMAARLIGQELGVEWIDRSDVSFNDRALAVQVPTLPDSPIASQTVATAHEAGWLWDIALPSRRGVGCVYSSRFMDDDAAAEVLAEYVAANVPGADSASLTPRRLQFATGHRAEFWRGNCLAVGLSAGFIEPLEASAIVLIELSLKALADNFPRSRDALTLHAARFNSLFRYRWGRTVDFLKLHYVLSYRREPYWLAQRDPATIPQSLADQLVLWRDHPPSEADFPQINEIFSAASQQYVLYGMGYVLPADSGFTAGDGATRKLTEVRERERALASALPTNRAYFDALAGEPARAQGEIASQ
ncbi:tryptophan halogenase family protein [Pelagerythrobacter aerophilus]|uniref:Tryptophan 7-halogenase n=1 Tax=Pelagerythrobacter aerophilus TaxID=2306995 RepID=A0A418NHM9_9SPHN|nr:tryptophan halogenase family protein [Pelagerythrobacter aerophilus]RIV78152.1 tryptophan 7-halogenase [Pelagerythrobacter aerophilus]